MNYFYPMGFSGFLPMMGFLLLWSLFWKGLALWHAGRKGQEWWFVALLVINSAGILDIAYLFLVLKLKGEQLFKK